MALSLLVTGCKPSAEGTPEEEGNLKMITILYGQYRAVNGKPPANLAEFKKFLESTKSSPTGAMKVTGDVDQFLTSPRDNQPYVFRWNVNARAGMPDVVAYEQTGTGSTRLVALGSGSVVDVDEEKFKQLVPDAP